MCGGGGGGSGSQVYNWNDTLQPLWEDQLKSGTTLAKKPYEPYPYQRIAELNPNQNQAISEIDHFVSGSGNGATQAANVQVTNTLNDKYLKGAGANPYASQMNAYEGDSPYFRGLLDTGLNDITSKYHEATAGNLARFGGANRNSSAYDGAVSRNEGTLAREMGNFSSSMLNDQYNRSAGLREGAINRASGAFEGERGRQMGAVGGGQNEQALALQRFNQLMGVGDVQRSYEQDTLNQSYNDWQTQQQFPFQMSDWLTGLFSRSQGGMAPNMTSTSSGYSASPFSSLLGAGLLGYGLTR